MIKTNLIWYIHKKTGLPVTPPTYDITQRQMLDNWFNKSIIQPKRLEIIDFCWKNNIKGNEYINYLEEELNKFRNEYEIGYVCTLPISV